MKGQGHSTFSSFGVLLWQRVEGDTAGEATVVRHGVAGEAVDKAREAAKR
jgi:hypothetical protein